MDKALHTTHGRATQHGIPNDKQNLHTTTGQSQRGTFGGTVREGRGEVKSDGKERESDAAELRRTQPQGTGQTQPKGTEQTQPQDRKGEGKPIPIKTNGLHLPSSLSYGSPGVAFGAARLHRFPSLSLSFPRFLSI